MSNTRTITICAIAATGVLFIGSAAMTQGNRPVTSVTNPVNVGNAAALAAANALALGVGTPVVFTLNGPARTFSVPVGRRLVIEYVSGLCKVNGDIPQFQTTTNGTVATHFLPYPVPVPTFIGEFFNPVGQLVKIYADPVSNVTLRGDFGSCGLTFSGQLVSL
jgi:hypothetical protein